jgi:hypothetical protein
MFVRHHGGKLDARDDYGAAWQQNDRLTAQTGMLWKILAARRTDRSSNGRPEREKDRIAERRRSYGTFASTHHPTENRTTHE